MNEAFEHNEKDTPTKQQQQQQQQQPPPPQQVTNEKVNGDVQHNEDDESHSVTIEDHGHSNGKDSEGEHIILLQFLCFKQILLDLLFVFFREE